MKTITFNLLLIIVLIPISCKENGAKNKFNFDFELSDKGTPVGWDHFGSTSYVLALDSTTVKSGKYSASIEFIDEVPNFKAWVYTIPESYDGKQITLTGYIKTENVTDGYAGLWMRIDPSVAFYNMHDRGVTGTSDWTKYEITLDLDPQNTEQIVIGGLLVGKGKMWIDDFSVTIDGKEINDLEPFEKALFPADLDMEFDNGSGIASISLTESRIRNLKELGLIWGFLKYYHPNIAKGDYNWDYELFRILPKILDVENNKDRDALLVKWIEGLGKYPEGNKRDISSLEIKIMPDLDWISNSGFSDKLTSLLLKAKDAERPNNHYYIALQPNVQNPIFKNEKEYTTMQFPDVGFRLLSLYRYWNIIQYYFPYKNLIEEDWKNVLDEFIPKIINANKEIDYTLTVLELIARIHDTHANIWGNRTLSYYYGIKYAPLELAFIENKAVVTDYFDEEKGKNTGLKIGDIITTINNKTIEEIVADKSKYTPASNFPTQLRNIAKNLLRTNATKIDIEYVRDEQPVKTTIKTYSTNVFKNPAKYQHTDTCFKIIDNDIAYLNNGSLKTEYLPDIWEELKNTKGLVIDIRNYPSDFLIYALSNYLMPESVPFVKFTNGSITTPGLFSFAKELNAGKENDDYYKGKIVIIVNELTQSSAEFHAMAYRVHPNATVIGSTTAGADGDVSKFSLPGGISTMISGIGVYYPDGKETQRIGIVPDMEIKPTIRGIKEGRDELLEKALEIINK